MTDIKGLMSSENHKWETPEYMFNDLDKVFKFTLDGKAAVILCGDEVFMQVPTEVANQWCELLNGAYRGGCNKCVSVYEAAENLGNSDLSGFEAIEPQTTGGTHMMPAETPIVHTKKTRIKFIFCH